VTVVMFPLVVNVGAALAWGSDVAAQVRVGVLLIALWNWSWHALTLNWAVMPWTSPVPPSRATVK